MVAGPNDDRPQRWTATDTIGEHPHTMQISHEVLGLYLHLARASEQRQRWLVRDKMLVLAGVTAADMQLPTVAAYCREKVLQHNPAHLVGHYAALEEALIDDDFLVYLNRLRGRYPRERAEHILDSLGISQAKERDSYYSDYEYAAALIGKTPAELDRQFSANADKMASEPSRASLPDAGPVSVDKPAAAKQDRRVTIVAAVLIAVALAVFTVVWYVVSR